MVKENPVYIVFTGVFKLLTRYLKCCSTYHGLIMELRGSDYTMFCVSGALFWDKRNGLYMQGIGFLPYLLIFSWKHKIQA